MDNEASNTLEKIKEFKLKCKDHPTDELKWFCKDDSKLMCF